MSRTVRLGKVEAHRYEATATAIRATAAAAMLYAAAERYEGYDPREDPLDGEDVQEDLRGNVLTECADLIQLACDVAARLGETDMAPLVRLASERDRA
jgi:ABC-type Zn uptake system ZnuABC Zn-binding protein ZnuA